MSVLPTAPGVTSAIDIQERDQSFHPPEIDPESNDPLIAILITAAYVMEYPQMPPFSAMKREETLPSDGCRMPITPRMKEMIGRGATKYRQFIAPLVEADTAPVPPEIEAEVMHHTIRNIPVLMAYIEYLYQKSLQEGYPDDVILLRPYVAETLSILGNFELGTCLVRVLDSKIGTEERQREFTGIPLPREEIQ